jgi:hypothetical protein
MGPMLTDSKSVTVLSPGRCARTCVVTGICPSKASADAYGAGSWDRAGGQQRSLAWKNWRGAEVAAATGGSLTGALWRPTE